MPAWIHERAEHLLAKNPSMKKETAFAIATQQSHKLGKTPKGYGTAAGKREAKQKFNKSNKEYVKSPNPGGLETPKLSDKPKTKWTGSKLVPKTASAAAYTAMVDEMHKEAVNPGLVPAAIGALGGSALGAGAGALTAQSGQDRLQRALVGAGVGGVAGLLGGYGAGKLLKRAPTGPWRHPEQALPSVIINPKLASAHYFAMCDELQKKAFSGLSYMGKRLALGTGLGALGGAAVGAAGAGEGSRLKGALGGAALGAGAGYAAPRIASHMRAGQTFGQAAKGVGGEAMQSVREVGRRVAAPFRKAPADRILAQAKSINPDVAGAKMVQEVGAQLPAASRAQLEGMITPQMRAMGMTPEAAMQVASWGSKPGESLTQVINRMSAAGAPRSAASEAATHVGRRVSTGTQMAPTVSAFPFMPKAAAAIGQSLEEDVSELTASRKRSIESIGRLLSRIRFKEKKSSAGDNPYMLDKLHVEPKTRPFRANAPVPKYRVKRAFTESEYSGGLGPGRLNYFNYGPMDKVSGPPGDAGKKKEKKSCGYPKMASMSTELCKLNAVMSPSSQLTKTQRVGAPKVSAPPGPSVQQVSKPIGFGRAQPGATKSGAV